MVARINIQPGLARGYMRFVAAFSKKKKNCGYRWTKRAHTPSINGALSFLPTATSSGNSNSSSHSSDKCHIRHGEGEQAELDQPELFCFANELGLLESCTSHLLGSYSSTWNVLRPEGREQQQQPQQQQQQPAQPVAAGNGDAEEGWHDLVLGNVSLRRTCTVSLMVVVLQVSAFS